MRMREAAHVEAVGLAASARHHHQTNLADHRQQDRVGAFIAWFDTAFDTKCHAESLLGLATPLRRVARTDLSVPRSRRIVACGSRCLRHRRINTSTVLAGQTLAIKEADDGFGARASCALIWHTSIRNRKPYDPLERSCNRYRSTPPVTDVAATDSRKFAEREGFSARFQRLGNCGSEQPRRVVSTSTMSRNR